MAMSRQSFNRSLLAAGLAMGVGLYYFEATSRTILSFIAYAATGILVGYLLSKFFVLPSEADTCEAHDNKTIIAADTSETEKPGVHLLIARSVYSIVVLLVLWQSARSFLLAGNWTALPGFVTAILWIAAVGVGLVVWWIFRRRALNSASVNVSEADKSKYGNPDQVLSNLIFCWAGALGVAVAGMAAEVTVAGLLMTVSMIISAACLVAAFPRSSWIEQA